MRGFTLVYVIRQHDSQVHLWIDDDEFAFHQLKTDRMEIEQEFGSALIWKQEDGQKGTLIGALINGGYRSDREDWPKIQRDLVDAMVKMEKVIKPRLARRYRKDE